MSVIEAFTLIVAIVAIIDCVLCIINMVIGDQKMPILSMLEWANHS